MRASLGLGLLFLLGCHSASAPVVAEAPPVRTSTDPASPNVGPIEPAEPRRRGALTKTFTGAAPPALTVRNGFPVAQHVFIDWQPRGSLAPGAAQTFDLVPGTHTVTCADSPNVDDNAVAVTEALDAGFSYEYRVAPFPDEDGVRRAPPSP